MLGTCTPEAVGARQLVVLWRVPVLPLRVQTMPVSLNWLLLLLAAPTLG